MKVLIVGHGDFYSGGKIAFMMEALLAAGHETEYKKLEDMPPGTYNVTFDECRTLLVDERRDYQRALVQEMITSIREQEVIKIKRNPGPRDRWGKVK